MNTYIIIKIGDMLTLHHPDIGTIPPDPENRHYAEYLEWVAAGNTAEEVTPEL